MHRKPKCHKTAPNPTDPASLPLRISYTVIISNPQYLVKVGQVKA